MKSGCTECSSQNDRGESTVNGKDRSFSEKDSRVMNRLLASVNIFVEPSQKDKVLTALAELKNIEEIYEVAGEYDIVSLVSASLP